MVSGKCWLRNILDSEYGLRYIPDEALLGPLGSRSVPAERLGKVGLLPELRSAMGKGAALRFAKGLPRLPSGAS